jgi:hypothetical protein
VNWQLLALTILHWRDLSLSLFGPLGIFAVSRLNDSVATKVETIARLFLAILFPYLVQIRQVVNYSNTRMK